MTDSPDVGGAPERSRPISRAFGLARVLIVVFGALVVLQSTQDVGPIKVAYLAVVSVVVLFSVSNVRRWRKSTVVAAAKPWLVASGVIGGLIALSLPVAISRGTPISIWLRDAAAYGLLLAAPWLAVDLALSTSRRVVLALTVAAGVAATVSYTLVWLQRRHIADFPIDRLALPSLILAAALFAVALALAVAGGRYRYLWAALASMTIALLVYSGTRASLVLLVVCPITLFAAWLSDRGAPVRQKVFVTVVPILAAIAIIGASQIRAVGDGANVGSGPTATSEALASAAPSGASGPTASGGPTIGPQSASPQPEPSHQLGERFDSIGTVFSGKDASLQDRLSQTRAVWVVFLSSPIIGGGLGVPIPWTDSSGTYHTDNAFTADSPILVLAKFGLLGLVLVVALGWASILTIRTLGGGGLATRPSWLATIAFASAILLLMPFGWQLEDKGTALAVVLVLAFSLVEWRDAHPPDSAESNSAVGPIGSREATSVRPEPAATQS